MKHLGLSFTKSLVNRIGCSPLVHTAMNRTLGLSMRKMWRVLCDFKGKVQYKSQEMREVLSHWPCIALNLILCFLLVGGHWVWEATLCQARGTIGLKRWLRHDFSPWGPHSLSQYRSTSFLPACCGRWKSGAEQNDYWI